MVKETKNLEYKEKVTNTFLKTVSAYANFGTGEIIFGITDDGKKVGVKNPEATCLDIENMINGNISPVPNYSLHIDYKTNIVTLTVEEGDFKPYFYKSIAYKRNDTSTVQVDRVELSRLILDGQNLTYEGQPSKEQNLKFSILESKLKDALHINAISDDILKTLELSNDKNCFNNAGALLADKNNFCGIDIACFGETIDIIRYRKTFANISILEQYDEAISVYRQYYQYEQIKGSLRELVESVPEKAYREAIANAIIHRTWDIDAHINVAMFKDRIEITSPGGLPKGVSEEDYLKGGLSVLRNRIIGNVFYRLHIVERFGTGIKRINESYTQNILKPKYDVLSDSIKITLPVLNTNIDLSNDEKLVYEFIKNKKLVNSAQITKNCDFGKSKVIKILNKLISLGLVKKEGSGRSVVYLI